MGTTEFEQHIKLSEPRDIKAPMADFLMWVAFLAGGTGKFEVKGSESFRVISKESSITELK